MHTPAIARAYLQQALEAVRTVERNEAASIDEYLDAHARFFACLDLAELRDLVDTRAAAQWRKCVAAAGPASHCPSPAEVAHASRFVASPVECPAWDLVWDASDSVAELRIELRCLVACKCPDCDHAEDVAGVKAELERRQTWEGKPDPLASSSDFDNDRHPPVFIGGARLL